MLGSGEIYIGLEEGKAEGVAHSISQVLIVFVVTVKALGPS
jgi:hypothetical protein